MGGLLPFSAVAKALGKFPQTGRSPKSIANQPANNWVADQADISPSGFERNLLSQHQNTGPGSD